MKKIAAILVLFIGFYSHSQEFNRLDEKGRKQGPYKKYFESAQDKVFYTGQFKDDLPYGLFTYYYKNGKVKSLMNYSKNGLVRSQVFTDKGVLIAKGNYINKLKDSVWTYYSNKKIQSIETWENGKREGIEIVYYSQPDTSEVKHWKNDKLEGPFRQYFPDGRLKMQSFMQGDEFEGETVFFHENGKLNMKGKYVNGLRDGSWYHYNKDGSLKMQVLYERGDVVREKRENGLFVEYFEPEMPQAELNYKNGMKNGSFTIYHEGAKRVLQDEIDRNTGDVIKKEVVKGIQPKMQGTYKNDKLHGKILHFNKAGVIVKTENFENGTLVNK